MVADSRSLTKDDLAHARLRKLEQAVVAADQIVLGKDAQIRLCLACLMAGGHLPEQRRAGGDHHRGR